MSGKGWSVLTGMAVFLFGVSLSRVAPAQPAELLAEGLEPVSRLDARSVRSSVPLAHPFRAVASGPLLEIIDETQPSGQAPVASLLLPSNIIALSHAAGKLVLSLNRQGLEVVDASNPAAPRLAGRFTQADVQNIQLSPDGEYAYILFGAKSFQIVSLKNLDSPRLANTRSVDGALFQQGLVTGRVLILAAEKMGVVVYSLEDPKRPKKLSIFKELKSVYRVAAAGRLVAAFDADEGLVFLDYSSWSSPKRLGSLPMDSHAFGAAFSSADPSLLLVADGGTGLRIVNAADPAHPVDAGRAGTFGPSLDVSAADGGAFFAAGGESGFWRLASPSAPPQRWLEGSLPTGALTARGSLVYLAVDSKIQVWDMAIPISPTLLGEAPLPLPAVYLETTGDRLLASCQQAGVQIFDLSAGGLPLALGAFVFDGSAGQTALSGNLLAVAGGSGGAVLADVSTPASPVQLSVWRPKVGAVSGVAFQSPSVLWVTAGSTGIRSLDVADPRNPATKSDPVSFDSNTGFLYVVGDHLYQPNRDGGLNIVDVSDPANPKDKITLPPYTAFAIHADSPVLGVADGYDGLTLLDISTPQKAFPTSRFGIPGFAYGVAQLPDGAWVVSAREGGVWVLRRTTCDGPILRQPCDGAHLPPTDAPIFHWAPTSGAKYLVKISTDASFPDNSKKTYTSPELHSPGFFVDLPLWQWMLKRGEGGAVALYWKVVTLVGGNRTASEVRTFRIG
ncbi:MAG: LVIVD repeat-containing protein [Acidobacteriota bacterium]